MCPLVVLSQEIMTANESATKTINGTINEMLRIINGEKTKQRNWEAFKSLFTPTVRFTVVYNDVSNPYETATVDEMIAFMKDDYYDNGYNEKLISRQIDEFNGIAQVLEVVEHTEPDGTRTKGLNSYHLICSKGSWLIANIIWTSETDKIKIPEKYLKTNK